MKTCDIAVIGGGPAGVMAAVRAGQLKKNIVLIERNASIGKKLLLTGKGRCNLTNMAPIEKFIENFGREGSFYRSAFHKFFNKDLVEFFKSRGLRLKMERQGRVFPLDDKAESVVNALRKSLSETRVEVCYNMRLLGIKKKGALLQMDFISSESLLAKKIILATGGASYRKTGSSGDGYKIAEKLEHSIVPIRPGLVPMLTREKWVDSIKGLSLKNVRLIFVYEKKKKIVSPIGECVFTHFGLSGPLVLDLSSRIVPIVEKYGTVKLFIDLKPGLEMEKLKARFAREFRDSSNKEIGNLMKNLLPQNLVPIFLRMAHVDPHKKTNQMTKKDRHFILELLKNFPLTITGALPIEEAMVTGGGVSTKEIDPRTMESKIVKGLYFAGEVIDGCSSSGGYSLQQAFSTGYLAGENAARA